MLNKKERFEKLSAAGINVDKYFTVDLDNGTKIHLIIDENGNLKQVKDDQIMEQIIDSGYVRNTKLHRRFVMAKMFQMLSYDVRNGVDKGYSAALNNWYGYDYTLKMMLEEVRVLSKLEEKDAETFRERSHFFTKDVIASVLLDHKDKLKTYVDKLPVKHCKGVPYKRVRHTDIFVEDLPKKLYNPIERIACGVRYAKSYKEVYRLLNGFVHTMIKLSWLTDKSKDWIDAYKGNGAYYTMKNLLMWHNCYIEDNKGRKWYGIAAVDYLATKLDEYQGEGWRMFALMKKVIKDNGIDTKTYIAEYCND